MCERSVAMKRILEWVKSQNVFVIGLIAAPLLPILLPLALVIILGELIKSLIKEFTC